MVGGWGGCHSSQNTEETWTASIAKFHTHRKVIFTQMYRTDFWTLWEKARVGCFERTA